MRIAVLAHNMRAAGGLTVGRNTIAALRRVADEHEYFLALPAGAGYESLELPTRSQVRYFHRAAGARGVVKQLWFDFARLGNIVRAQRPDVVWGLGNFGLRRPGCPQAFVCQDAHFVYDPAKQPRRLWSKTADYRVSLWRMRRSLPWTGLVFCPTQVLLDRFRATFAYQGQMALLPAAISRAEDTVGTARPAVFERLTGKLVLLALTRYYRHKNLEVLIEMFERHGERLRDVTVVLTIDPAQGYGADKFLKRIETSAARDHFVNVGSVGRSELAAYYRNAQALIMPSVLETTGLPYFEAMQYGTPVLAGDMDFAREACGDAALYFDPWNADSVFEAVARFRNDPSIGPLLVERGGKRAATMICSVDDIVRGGVERLEQLVRTAGR